MPPLHVHLLPPSAGARHGAAVRLEGGTAVVIDVLRATSTIVHALDSGAARVVPCKQVDQALVHRGRDPRVLLGGERGGVRIPGFDLDNSPYSYGPETVAGRTIAFTTTNGTAAVEAARTAAVVYAGAFANLSALLDALGRSSGHVHLICAGTDGEVTLEDVLLAGAVVDRWEPSRWASDSAALAADLFRVRRRRIEETLRESRGGRNLIELGFERDVVWCAREDTCATVPVLHPELGFVRRCAAEEPRPHG
jgi:2-phosphosulfolactate phosphatase